MEVVVLSIAITAILLSLAAIGVHTLLYTRQVQLHHSMLQVQSEVVRDNAEFGNRMHQLLGRIEGRLTGGYELSDSRLQQVVESVRLLAEANATRSGTKNERSDSVRTHDEYQEPLVSTPDSPPADGHKVEAAISSARVPEVESVTPARPAAAATKVPQSQIVLGKAKADGQPVPSGSQVQALVKGVELARATVKSEGFFQLSVPSPSLIGRPEGSVLQFAVLLHGDEEQKHLTDKHVRWMAGEVSELNLEV